MAVEMLGGGLGGHQAESATPGDDEWQWSLSCAVISVIKAYSERQWNVI